MFKFYWLHLCTFAISLTIASTSHAQYGGGTGTIGDPYLIYDPNQMKAIGANSTDWDKHFDIMSDIDMSSIGNAYNIIGTQGNPFTGVFNGNNHTISNLTINTALLGGVGLFGVIEGTNAIDGIVRELGLISPQITANSATSVGGIVGFLTFGSALWNCYVEGGSVSGDRFVGGLVGAASLGPSVSHCYSTCSVSGSDDSTGGLIGRGVYFILEDCYAGGNVSGTFEAGGLIGAIGSAYLYRCYSYGSVSGISDVGGLVGLDSGGNLFLDNFWDTQTSGQATSAIGTGKTTTEMQNQATYLNAGWDFVGEEVNGVADVWRMCVDGVSYPRLQWEYAKYGDWVCPDGVFVEDLGVLVDEWLLGLLGYDVVPVGGDGVVNLLDFVALGQDGPPYDLVGFVDEWLETGTVYDDLAPNGGDGYFNLYDFSALAANWMAEI